MDRESLSPNSRITKYSSPFSGPRQVSKEDVDLIEDRLSLKVYHYPSSGIKHLYASHQLTQHDKAKEFDSMKAMHVGKDLNRLNTTIIDVGQ